MLERPLEELDPGETLDAFERWHQEQVEREIAKFLAAAHFADLHSVASETETVPLAGAERGRLLGGAGTPLVREFAAAELGARMGTSPYSGRTLMADALDVRHRFPLLWRRVRAGEVPVGNARFVAQQTRELSAAEAGYVDAEVSPYADGRLPWSRLAALVAGKVVAANPEAAAGKERRAAEEEFAKIGRSNEHGQKTLYVRSGAAAMIRIDATIDYLAEGLRALGDDDSEDRRRAKAILVMANPAQALAVLQAFAVQRTSTHDAPEDHHRPAGDRQADGGVGDPTSRFLAPFRPTDVDEPTGFRLDDRTLLPQVTLYLHLHQHAVDTARGGVVRWEGEGPVTTDYVRDFLGPRCRFVVKPVIDLNGLAPVDSYEIPDRHREAVHLRTPADVFPFAVGTTTTAGRRRQVDHTVPYVPPDEGGPLGQTGLDNLGPLTAFHHRIKTFGEWQVRQPFPGIYLWRDPHGRCYLVDHTGTRPLGMAEPSDDATAGLTLAVYESAHHIGLAEWSPHAA